LYEQPKSPGERLDLKHVLQVEAAFEARIGKFLVSPSFEMDIHGGGASCPSATPWKEYNRQGILHHIACQISPQKMSKCCAFRLITRAQ
jgi:hypothetical protein